MDTNDDQYLTKEELEISKSSPRERKELARLGKSRLEDNRKRYCLSQDRNIVPSEDKEELRVVVFGKTGVGKSATANSLLGRKSFKEGIGSITVTAESKCLTAYYKGRRIKVVDTPGLFDPNQTQEKTLNEIARVIQVFDRGIHAFLYVLNMATPRFTKEDSETLKMVEEKFGGHMSPYRLIVYTHAENLQGDMTLDTFVKKQRNSNPFLVRLFQESNNNVVALNNTTSILAEKKMNQNVILAKIDKIRKNNARRPVYTNTVFQSAAQKIKDLTDEVTAKGAHPQIMSTGQELYAVSAQLISDPRKVEHLLTTHLQKEKGEGQNNYDQQLDIKVVKYHASSEKNMEEIVEALSFKEEGDMNLSDIPDDVFKALNEMDIKEFEKMCKNVFLMTLSIQKMIRQMWQERGLTGMN